MRFWTTPSLLELGILGVLLLLVAFARGVIGTPEQRWPLPHSILAGTLGLLLGPTALDLLPVATANLEQWVYHGLALTFIVFGLRRPQSGKSNPNVRVMMFALPVVNLLQGVLGLSFVLLWSGWVEPMHPGFGWMLPLGFSQGPGQALSIGDALEKQGMQHGGQIGLAMAAMGFAWSAVIGAGLISWGRHRGLISRTPRARTEVELADGVSPVGVARHLGVVVVVYTLTYAILRGVVSVLPATSDIVPLVWGFHFLVGLGLALSLRMLLPNQTPLLDDTLLARMAGVVVDFTTVGALAAVRLDVVAVHIVPLLLLTTLGGLLTLVFTLWHASRSYPDAPFEHAVCFFGTTTGTLPTGLALLRTLDPDLRGPAGTTQVVGGAASIPFSIPLMLFFLPYPTRNWPESFPDTTIQVIAMALLYIFGLCAIWWWLGALRLKPWWPLWQPRDA